MLKIPNFFLYKVPSVLKTRELLSRSVLQMREQNIKKRKVISGRNFQRIVSLPLLKTCIDLRNCHQNSFTELATTRHC